MRFQEAKLNINKPLTIFISHLHLDHYGGLPSLLRGLSILGRTNPIEIHCSMSMSIKDYVGFLDDLKYKVSVYDLNTGIDYKSNNGKYIVKIGNANHRQTLNYAFRVEENVDTFYFDWQKAESFKIPKRFWKQLRDNFNDNVEFLIIDGVSYEPKQFFIHNEYKKPRIFCYSGDTAPFPESVELFKDASLLVHDATYLNEHLVIAIEHKHSTALSATRCAMRAGVKFLLLAHRSRRYFPGREQDHLIEDYNRNNKETTKRRDRDRNSSRPNANPSNDGYQTG